VTDLSPFGDAEWVPSPSIAYGSQSPPLIPDGRMSRVRFEATTPPRCACLSRSRVKPGVGIHASSDRWRTASPRCSAAVFSQGHLHPAYLPVALCAHRPFARAVLPAPPGSDGLMCPSHGLRSPMPGDSVTGLCRVDPLRLVRGTLPT
jgi:hypothetical protein